MAYRAQPPAPKPTSTGAIVFMTIGLSAAAVFVIILLVRFILPDILRAAHDDPVSYHEIRKAQEESQRARDERDRVEREEKEAARRRIDEEWERLGRSSCSHCKGSGKEYGTERRCAKCDGTGLANRPCPSCHGEKLIPLNGKLCPTCKGEGQIPNTLPAPPGR